MFGQERQNKFAKQQQSLDQFHQQQKKTTIGQTVRIRRNIDHNQEDQCVNMNSSKTGNDLRPLQIQAPHSGNDPHENSYALASLGASDIIFKNSNSSKKVYERQKNGGTFKDTKNAPFSLNEYGMAGMISLDAQNESSEFQRHQKRQVVQDDPILIGAAYDQSVQSMCLQNSESRQTVVQNEEIARKEESQIKQAILEDSSKETPQIHLAKEHSLRDSIPLGMPKVQNNNTSGQPETKLAISKQSSSKVGLFRLDLNKIRQQQSIDRDQIIATNGGGAKSNSTKKSGQAMRRRELESSFGGGENIQDSSSFIKPAGFGTARPHPTQQDLVEEQDLYFERTANGGLTTRRSGEGDKVNGDSLQNNFNLGKTSQVGGQSTRRQNSKEIPTDRLIKTQTQLLEKCSKLFGQVSKELSVAEEKRATYSKHMKIFQKEVQQKEFQLEMLLQKQASFKEQIFTDIYQFDRRRETIPMQSPLSSTMQQRLQDTYSHKFQNPITQHATYSTEQQMLILGMLRLQTHSLAHFKTIFSEQSLCKLQNKQKDTNSQCGFSSDSDSDSANSETDSASLNLNSTKAKGNQSKQFIDKDKRVPIVADFDASNPILKSLMPSWQRLEDLQTQIDTVREELKKIEQKKSSAYFRRSLQIQKIDDYSNDKSSLADLIQIIETNISDLRVRENELRESQADLALSQQLSQNQEDKRFLIASEDYLACKCLYSEKKVVEVIFKTKLIISLALNDKQLQDQEESQENSVDLKETPLKSRISDWKESILSDHLRQTLKSRKQIETDFIKKKIHFVSEFRFNNNTQSGNQSWQIPHNNHSQNQNMTIQPPNQSQLENTKTTNNFDFGQTQSIKQSELPSRSTNITQEHQRQRAIFSNSPKNHQFYGLKSKETVGGQLRDLISSSKKSTNLLKTHTQTYTTNLNSSSIVASSFKGNHQSPSPPAGRQIRGPKNNFDNQMTSPSKARQQKISEPVASKSPNKRLTASKMAINPDLEQQQAQFGETNKLITQKTESNHIMPIISPQNASYFTKNGKEVVDPSTYYQLQSPLQNYRSRQEQQLMPSILQNSVFDSTQTKPRTQRNLKASLNIDDTTDNYGLKYSSKRRRRSILSRQSEDLCEQTGEIGSSQNSKIYKKSMGSPKSNKSYAIQIQQSCGESFDEEQAAEDSDEARPFQVKTPERKQSPRNNERHQRPSTANNNVVIRERDMTEKKLFKSSNQQEEDRALDSARKEMGNGLQTGNKNFYKTQRLFAKNNNLIDINRLDESKRSTPSTVIVQEKEKKVVEQKSLPISSSFMKHQGKSQNGINCLGEGIESEQKQEDMQRSLKVGNRARLDSNYEIQETPILNPLFNSAVIKVGGRLSQTQHGFQKNPHAVKQTDKSRSDVQQSSSIEVSLEKKESSQMEILVEKGEENIRQKLIEQQRQYAAEQQEDDSITKFNQQMNINDLIGSFEDEEESKNYVEDQHFQPSIRQGGIEHQTQFRDDNHGVLNSRKFTQTTTTGVDLQTTQTVQEAIKDSQKGSKMAGKFKHENDKILQKSNTEKIRFEPIASGADEDQSRFYADQQQYNTSKTSSQLTVNVDQEEQKSTQRTTKATTQRSTDLSKKEGKKQLSKVSRKPRKLDKKRHQQQANEQKDQLQKVNKEDDLVRQQSVPQSKQEQSEVYYEKEDPLVDTPRGDPRRNRFVFGQRELDSRSQQHQAAAFSSNSTILESRNGRLQPRHQQQPLPQYIGAKTRQNGQSMSMKGCFCFCMPAGNNPQANSRPSISSNSNQARGSSPNHVKQTKKQSNVNIIGSN